MAVLQATPGMPAFMELAGHPLRWWLLSELARSDRRVRELSAVTGEPQSLVSYHLGRLRAGGLVGARRSSADGRDTYYSVDLAQCSDLVVATGAALHPGVRLARVAGEGEPRRRRGSRVPTVLFLCTGNSARSQMAEAFVSARGESCVKASSAGSHPKPVHPNTVRVMRSRGIDIGGWRSKHLDEFTGRRFDHVVTLCDRVREACPEFPGRPPVAHWSMADPSASGATNKEMRPAFEAAANEIEQRVDFLLACIDRTTPRGSRKP